MKTPYFNQMEKRLIVLGVVGIVFFLAFWGMVGYLLWNVVDVLHTLARKP